MMNKDKIAKKALGKMAKKQVGKKAFGKKSMSTVESRGKAIAEMTKKEAKSYKSK